MTLFPVFRPLCLFVFSGAFFVHIYIYMFLVFFGGIFHFLISNSNVFRV